MSETQKKVQEEITKGATPRVVPDQSDAQPETARMALVPVELLTAIIWFIKGGDNGEDGKDLVKDLSRVSVQDVPITKG